MRRFVNHAHPALLTIALLVSARASAAQFAKSFEIGLPWVAPKQASLDLLVVGVRVGSRKPLESGGVDRDDRGRPHARAHRGA